jgi:asparagine synthase (glutamine-hydrolysing)
MYFVCQRAREDVKVALIGQGPDELFGGYKRHLGIYYGQLWRRMPAGVRSLAASVIEHLPRNETLKRGALSLGDENTLKRYQQVFSMAPAEAIDGLFRDELVTNFHWLEGVECWQGLVPQMEFIDELGGFQLLEVRSSLPDELLMFADKLSMAHSLEVRVPYLDRTVVEYALRLEAAYKIRGGTGKWLHRNVCRRFLQPSLLRRRKRGFASNVVDAWFSSSLRGSLQELLLDEESLLFDFLKREPVHRLLETHKAQRQDNHKLLFSLAVVEQWLRGVQSDSLYKRPAYLN